MKLAKKCAVLLLTICLLFAMGGCGCGQAEATKEFGELLTGEYKIEIVMKDYGTIKATLDADAAPYTVTNFVELVEEGFYDGLTFHRIITDFMMQGGDPQADGYGGSGETIPGEFSTNGIENSISHTRGTISMARANGNNTASSQFFIMQKDQTALDGYFAAFGYVTEGMEIVDEICNNTPVTDDDGTVEPENQPIIETIRVVE